MSNASVTDSKVRVYDVDLVAKKKLEEDHLKNMLGLIFDNEVLKKEREFLLDKLKKLVPYIHHETWCKVNSLLFDGNTASPMGSCNCCLDSLLKSEIKK